MAIFAQRTRKTNSYLPDFKLITTPMAGQVFAWDPIKGAFVNKNVSEIYDGGSSGGTDPDPNLANYVNGGVNLSSNYPIFKQKNNQKLEFRGLVAGGGITLNNMGNDIRIGNEVFETGRWENSGIDIVFDNGGNLEFFKRGYRFQFQPTISYSAPSGDIEIIANTPGQIRSISQNFSALGFFAGQKIRLDGTGEQDGEWTIANVNGNLMTLTTAFNSNLDAGFQPACAIKGSRLQFINSIRFALYGIDLSQQDLAVGDVIVFEGTANNDSQYTIQLIAGNQIEISEVFTSPFEYEYGDITINTLEEDLPIGVSIDSDGTITGITGNFQNIHTTDLVAENILIGNQTLEEYIDNISSDLPSGGILVGTDDGAIVREIEVGPGLLITDADGYDANPKISIKDFYLNLTGDVSGYATVSGLANTTINMELDQVGSPGQYNYVTVDDKGRVVFGARRTIQAGSGINVVNGDWLAGDTTISMKSFNVVLTGYIEGEATITGDNAVVIDTTLSSAASSSVTVPGWYNRVQIDSAGTVLAGQNQSILGSNGVTITNPDGVAGSPVISVRNFDLIVNGDVTGFATVNALSNTVLNLQLPDLMIPGNYNQVTIDSKGRVIAAQNVTYDFQDQNDNLDLLAAPTFSAGLLNWNGTEYETYTLGAAVDQLEISYSGSVINFSLVDNPVFTGVESITIPFGPTNFRPSAPTSGMLRINTNDTSIEAYINGDWRVFVPGGNQPSLELQGGTMSGDIDMDGNDILNVGTINGIDIEDLASSLDEINTGTGFKVSTPSGIENRTLTTPIGSGLTIQNPDGVSGDPEISFSVFDFNSSNSSPADNDEIIYHDISDNQTKKTTVESLFKRQAINYFMAQF